MYLYCCKNGLSIHLIFTRAVLVEKYLLWMGISAQSLRLFRGTSHIRTNHCTTAVFFFPESGYKYNVNQHRLYSQTQIAFKYSIHILDKDMTCSYHQCTVWEVAPQRDCHHFHPQSKCTGLKTLLNLQSFPPQKWTWICVGIKANIIAVTSSFN